MDIFDTYKIILFFLFFVPGFISIKVWGILKPADKIDAVTYILEAVSFSSLNYALFSPIFISIWLNWDSNFYWYHYLVMIVVIFISPLCLPLLYSKIVDSERLQGHIKHPIPKAWDYFFSRGEACFMMIHLKNGDVIGGIFGSNSFASSYPAEEDIYIEKVWQINEMCKFLEEPIADTKGILINKAAIDYIECFNS